MIYFFVISIGDDKKKNFLINISCYLFETCLENYPCIRKRKNKRNNLKSSY